MDVTKLIKIFIAGDDYTRLAEDYVFNCNFGVKRAVDEFVFEQKKNVSIDLTGEWYYKMIVNGSEMLYFSRNWYFFK